MERKAKSISDRILKNGMNIHVIEKSIEESIIDTDFFETLDMKKLKESMSKIS